MLKMYLYQVSIRYGDRVALQRTDLVIEAGTIHGIIGPAGGGKTSFLRTLNLMSVELDGAHADGSIRIGDDEEILSDPPGATRSRDAFAAA